MAWTTAAEPDRSQSVTAAGSRPALLVEVRSTAASGTDRRKVWIDGAWR